MRRWEISRRLIFLDLVGVVTRGLPNSGQQEFACEHYPEAECS
jgi:hypothetical protein